MDKVVIRKATMDDKDEVIAIRDNVYDGHDYLPAYYEHFVSSGFIPYVMVYDGKIIMFEVIQIVDDGRTQVGRAGRINPIYENQGFTKHLSASLNKWRQQNNIKTIAFVINDANPAMYKATFQKRYRHISTKHIPIYYLDMDRVNAMMTEEEIQKANQLRVVSAETLSQFFKSARTKEYLCPHGRMIVDLVPFKMIDSNIVYMIGTKPYTTVFSDIRHENGICSGLLSFGTLFQDKRLNFHFNLDIFGTETNSLKQHIVRHILEMRSKVKGIVRIMAMVEEEFSIQSLNLCFGDFGVQRSVWFSSVYPHLKYTKIFLYEREFHPSKY